MTKEIRLPAPHPRFRPRIEGGVRRPGHPGTAVRIGADFYEVAAAEKTGGEWVYRLEPWRGQETIRADVEWDEGSEREFAAGLRADRIRAGNRFLAWSAQVFLGFLPAKNQERLSHETGVDPARATLWSAMLEVFVALPFALWFVIGLFAGSLSPLGRSLPTAAGVLALVAAGDGAFRLVAVISTGEPIGSLFLILLGLRLRSEGPQYDPADGISSIEGALTVVSPVRKAWWERAGGVTYEGEPYFMAGSGREKTRFIYRFQKGGEGFPILDPELEKLRNKSSDLSYVFAPLWGFLPSGFQKALEFYGRYKPRPNVIFSCCMNLLMALAIVEPGLGNVSRGVYEIWSLALLAFAIALSVESVARLLRLIWDGKATGSFLAFLVKPAYDLVFKDKPVPLS